MSTLVGFGVSGVNIEGIGASCVDAGGSDVGEYIDMGFA